MDNNTPKHTGKRFKQAVPVQDSANIQTKANPRFRQSAVASSNSVSKANTINIPAGDKKPKKKNSVGKNIGLGILFLVLALAVVAFAYIHHINSQMAIKDQKEAEELQQILDKKKEKNDFYALIMGSDSREQSTKGTRSDVTMLVHVDANDGVLELISIPRDTAINIPGHGMQKINASYAIDGPSGMVMAVNDFAGVPIAHFALVKFEDLVNVVDMLGGVEVNVPQSFAGGNGGMSFKKGVQTINGKQALAFARERYNVKGGDFSRAQAQRMIVKGIIDKVLKAPATELPGIVSNLAGSVDTDMDAMTLIGLAQKFQANGCKMYSAACPSYSFSKGGVSYVGTMYDEWKTMMQRVDANMDPNSSEGEIPEAQKNNAKLGQAINGAGDKDYKNRDYRGLTTDDIIIPE